MLCYSVGDKVRLVKDTLFVGRGGEGTVVEPFKGQTPPQLFPNRVQFQMGQDVRTVWCGTDELELVNDGPLVTLSKQGWGADDTRLTTDDQVADGSRDYCSEGGPEDRDPVDSFATNACLPCSCLTGGPCDLTGGLVDDWGPETYHLDPANNPDLDGCLAERYGDEQEGPWSEDWEWDGLSQFEEAVVGVFVDAQELLFKKHKDYGPKNISQSPGGALNGLRVRMWDKLARLSHLYDKQYKDSVLTNDETSVRDEKLTDTLLDLANYAVIAVLVLRGEWPSE